MNSEPVNAYETSYPLNIWIISKGSVGHGLKKLFKDSSIGPGLEYRISDLALYLLNPNPIEVKKKLIGCEIRYRLPFFRAFKQKVRRLLPKRIFGAPNNEDVPTEIIMSPCNTKMFPLKDKGLERHFNRIDDFLQPYDSTLKRLSVLNMSKIDDVIGICEDFSNSRSWLNLQGDIHEKINYIIEFLSKDVGVFLQKAYLSDGLFEMRGFDFETYDSSRSHRLIKFFQNGKTKCCALNPDNSVRYWVEETGLIRYMQLLEQSIQMNHKLRDSINQCAEGYAKPLKLFFNKEFRIDYSNTHLPKIYKELFEAYTLEPDKKDAVVNILNNLQLGISFHYIPQFHSGKSELFTSISVMHDMKALEPLKDNVPQLYSDISKRASLSEAGRFYLLDSIRGYFNEN